MRKKKNDSKSDVKSTFHKSLPNAKIVKYFVPI